MNNFTIYYPEYNIENVIENYNNFLQKRKIAHRKKNMTNIILLEHLANSPNIKLNRAGYDIGFSKKLKSMITLKNTKGTWIDICEEVVEPKF